MLTLTLRRKASLATIAAGVALVAAAPAHAAFPGADGRIAFHSDRSIYTIDPTGARKVALPEDAIGFGGLSVSADGMRIAYSTSHQIFVVTVDGRAPRQLTHPADGASDQPVFSPDGRQIAFERGYGIWTMRSNGSGPRDITPGADITHPFADPAWSPDGTRIAYTYNQQVWVMNADGSQARPLTAAQPVCPSTTRTMNGSQPDWSPDGTRITFTGPVNCDNSRGRDIWVMNADGSGQHDLINDDGTEDSSPVFSPSGTRIAFTRDDGSGYTHLFTMSAAGGGLAQVATGLYQDEDPSWGAAYNTVRVSEKVSHRSVRRGRRLVVSGRVKPALHGKVVLVIRRGRAVVARKRVSLSRGRYHYAYKARRPGRYTVIATFPQGAHNLAATSPKRTFRVAR